MPYQTRSYEVGGITWFLADPPLLLTPTAFSAIIADPEDFLPYEQRLPTSLSTPAKRIIEWTRTYLRKNEAPGLLEAVETLDHRLALGEIESLGLPYENYGAALTDNLVKVIYGNDPSGSPRVSGNMRKEAGYHAEPDVSNYWWVRSGCQAFKEDTFYQPHKTQDPFGNVSEVTYDKYSLLIESTLDQLGNKLLAENDYRVLQPRQITDPNENITQLTFPFVIRSGHPSGRAADGP